MCWENWLSTQKKTHLDPCLTPQTKVGSGWIKDPTEKGKTIKVTEENVDLRNLRTVKDFLNKTSKAWRKLKIHEFVCIKIKNFCWTNLTDDRMGADIYKILIQRGLTSSIHNGYLTVRMCVSRINKQLLQINKNERQQLHGKVSKGYEQGSHGKETWTAAYKMFGLAWNQRNAD